MENVALAVAKRFVKMTGICVGIWSLPVPAILIGFKWGYWPGAVALVLTALLYTAWGMEVESRKSAHS